ncbi:MAG: PDR/VanB family oxidoreductase [Nocardioides sp.]|uniref:PDR/VanB family oxidoreductase n=1 Tax=Nocardioides sp. TaxID=35761 RepID=UPI003F00CF1E
MIYVMVFRSLAASLKRSKPSPTPTTTVTSFDPVAMAKAKEAARLAASAAGGETLDLVVRSVTTEAEGVISITFESFDAGELPAWTPGAHLELHLPSGLARQYSLCGDPADRESYRVAVLREESGRGGSKELHDTDLVGLRIKAVGPRNHFELTPSPSYRFIAGGIGITPIRAMVAAVPAGSEWTLLYGGRSSASMAFVEELRALGGDRVTLVPEDESGQLDLDAYLAGAGAGTAVYCCGPSGLISAVVDRCAALAPEASVTFERFTASEENAAARAAAAANDTEFTVELQRSGVTKVVAKDQTLLDAILAEDPGFGFSCEEGHCGSCLTKVLKGEVDHRDELLSDAERAANDQMYVCVSRAKGDHLVLDA